MLLLVFSGNIFKIYNISIVSLCILLSYVVFVVLLSKISIEQTNTEITEEKKNIYIKFVISSLALIILSFFLTLQANKIAIQNPVFSSSTIGAFLLGITTSLPEVVSLYALIILGNYNLCFANIVGSNAFNFMIISLCDLFISGETIYSFRDNDSMSFLIIGLLMHIIMIISILRKRHLCKLTYAIPSIIITLMYIYLFITHVFK